MCAKGLSIASGVIKGACRHVVNDLLNQTGMRWSLDDTQVMLRLRCVAISEQWEELMNEHIRRETQRLYPHRNPSDPIAPDAPDAPKIAA